MKLAASLIAAILTAAPLSCDPPIDTAAVAPAPVDLLRQAWIDSGATPREADRIVLIARGRTSRCRTGESAGKPDVINRYGYRGLTQIAPGYVDDLQALGIITTADDLFDPYTNGLAAWWLYRNAYGPGRGQGWGAWSCRDRAWPNSG